MVTDDDIMRIIVGLANENLIFHSEAKFQYELARKIAEHNPRWSVSIEKKMRGDLGKTMSMDILAETEDGKELAIEVKYQLVGNAKLSEVVNNTAGSVKFPEKTPGSSHANHYGFWRDVSRLEDFVGGKEGRKGFALFLTNDAGYWNPAKTVATVDREFRIDQARDLVWGPLHWYFQDGQRVKGNNGKHPAIGLRNKYSPAKGWQPWGAYGFQFLLLEVLA